ncbi:hypothetical protein [Leisingera methylohalidivorans]|uniref:hypothetical protein n=1 Tax=Leisingera methylohalidivorans TaxID=133924 RepID=UPI0005C6D85B|nr:hypothetical protein [Leisingera methylohalidivorans]
MAFVDLLAPIEVEGICEGVRWRCRVGLNDCPVKHRVALALGDVFRQFFPDHFITATGSFKQPLRFLLGLGASSGLQWKSMPPMW